MTVSFEIVELADHHVAAGRRLVATAFAGEPFAAGMFGDEPVARLVGMMGEYATWPSAAHPHALAAVADGVLLGVVSATGAGACTCGPPSDAPMADESHLPMSEQMELEFRRRVAHAHRTSGLPPHSHISTVATEPFVTGAGVGRALVAAAVQRQWDDGAACVVLECVSARLRFYEQCGFRMVTTFDDPAAPGLRTSLMRIDR